MNRQEALKRAQKMVDDGENAAFEADGAVRAGLMFTAARLQLDLVPWYEAESNPESPSEAGLGLLLKSLEDGSLATTIANTLEQGSGRMLAPEMSQVVANVVRGVLHAAPTEQRLDVIEPLETSTMWGDPEPFSEGKFFPSYRDASYRVTPEPLKTAELSDDPEPDLGDGSREYCYLPKPGDARQGLRCTFWRGHKGMHTWQVRP